MTEDMLLEQESALKALSSFDEVTWFSSRHAFRSGFQPRTALYSHRLLRKLSKFRSFCGFVPRFCGSRISQTTIWDFHRSSH